MEKRFKWDGDTLRLKDSLITRIADNKSVRRRKKLKTFRQLVSYFIFSALFLLVATFAGWKLYAYMITSPRFNINVIKVKGAHYISKEAMNARFSKIRGKNIFIIELQKIQEMLKENPWVDYCFIKRVLPNSLTIEIVEEKPAALLQIKGVLYLISWNGKVLQKYDAQKFSGLSLPFITNRSALGFGSIKEEIPIIIKAIREVKNSDPQMLDLIAEFGLSRKGILNLRFKEASFEVMLGKNNSYRRIKNLMLILPDIKKRFNNIDYIDLRFDHQIIIHQAREGR